MMVKGGLFGRLLEPVMYLRFRLGLPNGLAPLNIMWRPAGHLRAIHDILQAAINKVDRF
jgi:hypothetical protein